MLMKNCGPEEKPNHTVKIFIEAFIKEFKIEEKIEKEIPKSVTVNESDTLQQLRQGDGIIITKAVEKYIHEVNQQIENTFINENILQMTQQNLIEIN